MSKPNVEQIKSHQRRVSGAYRTTFMTPSGKIVMDDLEKQFENRAMAKTTKDGRIDVNATLINEGARQCVLYIKNRMRGDSNERLDD